MASLLLASLASDVAGDRLFCVGVTLATHQLSLGVAWLILSGEGRMGSGVALSVRRCPHRAALLII